LIKSSNGWNRSGDEDRFASQNISAPLRLFEMNRMRDTAGISRFAARLMMELPMK
jgi:hypothetical protein